MNSLRAHMALYRAEHHTVGCRITHMIGVPMIVASLPMLAWNWRVGLAMFVIGWTMQFAGHRYFERNKPVLMADPKNSLTYMAALVFVAQEWFSVLGGHRWSERRHTVRPLLPHPRRSRHVTARTQRSALKIHEAAATRKTTCDRRTGARARAR